MNAHVGNGAAYAKTLARAVFMPPAMTMDSVLMVFMETGSVHVTWAGRHHFAINALLGFLVLLVLVSALDLMALVLQGTPVTTTVTRTLFH